MISLDWCNGNCNNLDDPSVRICVSNKTKDLSLNIFDM